MAAREVDKVGEDEASHDNVWSAGSDVVDTGQRRSCDKDGFAMVKIWRGECYTLKEEMLVVKAVDSLHSEFRAVDNLVVCNTNRVLKAFQNARVGSHHFGGCTGYGHDEAGGRGALDQAFAKIFGAESAIVRHRSYNILICQQFFSGTHAITCALFALLRTGDELLAVAGAPYDTLEEVLGKRESGGLGSLQDFGVKYREVPGADLIAGSLIKNPGGTIAPCGGYIAGKKKCVEAAAARLSAPGLGVDCGSTPGDIMRAFFQGLFLSSQMVGEAIKFWHLKAIKCSLSPASPVLIQFRVAPIGLNGD
ncbi:hypothetical protein JHK85_016866 [Glycine max]|nr:hypothetical protein JHK85_016866 [Glycine max]